METPIIKLYRNPWESTTSDGIVLQFLLTAATIAQQHMGLYYDHRWPEGILPRSRNSFGAVLLDPTRPREATTLKQRVFASIELGPEGKKYLPNGLAKADAHDRHGKPNGFFVEQANFCLDNGDFAWGSSAEYNGAIGGGSGLYPSQDADLMGLILFHVMDQIHQHREGWIKHQRLDGKSHGWYNPDNQPRADYADIANWDAVTIDGV